MVDEKCFKQLYEGFIDNQVLSTKQLKEYGFHAYDLTNLLNEGVIVREKRGYYSFSSVDHLFHYGKELLAKKEYDRANDCFKKCYELDPNHLKTCFSLFFKSIKDANYEESFQYFDTLYQSQEKQYQNDYNYYLYLLSCVTEVPLKYQERIQKMRFKDIELSFDSEQAKKFYQRNQIRLSVLKQQFSLALQRYRVLKHQVKLATSDIMAVSLLNRAKLEQQKRGQKLLQLIQQHQYDSVIEFLESYEKTHRLNLFDESILFLTRDCVEIQKTGIIPKKHSNSSKFFSAIHNKDYESAWKISSEYVHHFKKHTSYNDAIYLLLKEIMLAKARFSSENNNRNLVPVPSASDVCFYTNAFQKIFQYLLTQDALMIQRWLDYIDTKASENTIQENSISCHMDNRTEFSSSLEEDRDSFSTEQVESIKQKSAISQDEEKMLYDRDVRFIERQIDNLCERGILLLRPMSLEREKRIHEIVSKISDIQSFSIGEGKLKQVVLRFCPYLFNIDLKTWMDEGNAAYKNGDYDLCIKNFKNMLASGEPPAFVYAKIGLSYMKKHENDIAIDYLTVANELNKKSNSSIDFSDLIAHLKGINQKPFFKMEMSEFDNDIDNYYGIDVIPQISKMLFLGISFEEACTNLEMNANEKNIATLIFARECFVQEKYSLGEEYLKKAEQEKEKSPFTISLIEEIRRNRRFYKYRNLEEHKSLVLTPQCRKR